MKSLVVCDSRAYGNTRKVAEAIASELEAEVMTPQQAGRTEIGDYDLVGFGSGIYAMNFYSDLCKFVDALPTMDGKKAFLFLTSASSERSMHKPVARLTAALGDHCYEVVGHFWCRGYWNPWLLRLMGGVNKGHPDRTDLESAREFARGLANADLRARPRTREVEAAVHTFTSSR